MKNILPFTFLTFFAANLCAQPVFTNYFTPQNGDLYIMVRFIPVNPGPSGANQTWNFTNIISFASNAYQISSASSVPCSNSYSLATQAIDSSGSSSMVDISTISYQFYGQTISSTVPGFIYSDPRQVFLFPMNYTNSFTDTYFGANQSGVYEYGSATTTFDGYGLVKTPYGNFSNAIRMHVSLTITDSASSVTCSGTREYYYWFVGGYQFPLVTIWSSTGTCGSTSGMEIVQQLGISVPETNVQKDVRVFPNPATDRVTFEFDEADKKILDLFDVGGKCILTTEFSNATTVETEDLTNGLYLARIKSDSGIVYKKILISK